MNPHSEDAAVDFVAIPCAEIALRVVLKARITTAGAISAMVLA
jgi:hypothetical protein